MALIFRLLCYSVEEPCSQTRNGDARAVTYSKVRPSECKMSCNDATNRLHSGQS
jgi:hypothetical protein